MPNEDQIEELKRIIEEERQEAAAKKKARTKQANALHVAWLKRKTPEERREYRRRTDPYRHKHKAEMRKKRKQELVALMGGKCQDCGGVFPPQVYDFHHIDPKDKTSIVAVLYQHKMERILKEIAGCIMICANCHRIRHGKDE